MRVEPPYRIRLTYPERCARRPTPTEQSPTWCSDVAELIWEPIDN